MERLAWIQDIPEVGDRYAERAAAIAKTKAELRTRLDEVLRAEAELWTDMVRSGHWTREETFRVLPKMDSDVADFLPNEI